MSQPHVSGSGSYAFPHRPQSNPEHPEQLDLPKKHMGWVVDGYVGEWKDSHHNPHGTGKMLFANGSTYDGQFTNGKFDGNGTISYEVDGVTELPGLDYMWSAGDKYDGGHLPAECFCNTLNMYDGGHRANVRHGACTYTFFTGEVFACTWADGICHEFAKRQKAIVNAAHSPSETLFQGDVVEWTPEGVDRSWCACLTTIEHLQGWRDPLWEIQSLVMCTWTSNVSAAFNPSVCHLVYSSFYFNLLLSRCGLCG